ncbi:MAG TPA: pseudouridine synthase [Coriobacteriia bacterium]|nr:pseudouridine synthase [Coriobacteriia bacterium]
MTSDSDSQRVVPMRLQKFLARAGVASRRGSEDLMTAGRVTVNGQVATELGTKVDPRTDDVTVDGKPVSLGTGCVYLILHKPRAVVTTMSDPQRRPTVAALVPTAAHPGLFPVGRLDADTTGLLLFTTDGELAHRILHPRWKVPKTYLALVDGVPTSKECDQLRNGVQLDDGLTSPAEVEEVSWSEGATQMRITISEGRKRQVRRMFSSVGHPVLELERTSFGAVEIGDLAPGEWRYLTEDELAGLRSAAGMEGE